MDGCGVQVGLSGLGATQGSDYNARSIRYAVDLLTLLFMGWQKVRTFHAKRAACIGLF
jgi:hypothetical protein